MRLQPEYIVFSQDDLGPAANEIADLRSRPVWRDLDAVELGHVLNISEGIERPSPDLVDVIEQLARDLHPVIACIIGTIDAEFARCLANRRI